MKKLTTMLLSLCLMLLTICASAMTLTPEAAPSSVSTKGTLQYYMSIVDDKQIESSGFLTIGLYAPEVFLIANVQKLKAGDTIRLNGQNVSIRKLNQTTEDWIEIVPEDGNYGYIYLVPSGNNPYCIAVVDDWVPCAMVSEMKVWMPLPDKFVYIAGPDEEHYTAGQFIRELQNGAGEYINQYNTVVTLENGAPVTITHTDYPEGPEF